MNTKKKAEKKRNDSKKKHWTDTAKKKVKNLLKNIVTIFERMTAKYTELSETDTESEVEKTYSDEYIESNEYSDDVKLKEILKLPSFALEGTLKKKQTEATTVPPFDLKTNYAPYNVQKYITNSALPPPDYAYRYFGYRPY